MTKAIIDFSGYTGAELSPVGHTIHDNMNANAATFGSPPITMTAFNADLTDYDTKLNAKASGAQADIVAFNAARSVVETDLGALGSYVNIVANGDPTVVVKSGFPSYETQRTIDTRPTRRSAKSRPAPGRCQRHLPCALPARPPTQHE